MRRQDWLLCWIILLQLERYEEAALLSFFEPLVDDRHNSILVRLIDDITISEAGRQEASSKKAFLRRQGSSRHLLNHNHISYLLTYSQINLAFGVPKDEQL